MCMFILHRDLIRTGLPCGQGLSSVSSPCGSHTFVDDCHLTHMQNLNFLIPWMKEFICCGFSHSSRCDAIGLPSSTELILNASEVVGVCKSCHTLSWSIKRNFGWVRVLSRNLQLWQLCPMVALIQFPSRMLTCRFRVPAICISRGRAALSTCMASKVDLPNVSQLCEKARLSLTPEEVNDSLIVWGVLRWLRIRNSSWFCCATCGW